MQARSANARYLAAQKLGLSDRWTLLLDTMDNQFAAAYSPWPFRYYLLDAHRCVRLIAEPINASLTLSDLWDAVKPLL